MIIHYDNIKTTNKAVKTGELYLFTEWDMNDLKGTPFKCIVKILTINEDEFLIKIDCKSVKILNHVSGKPNKNEVFIVKIKKANNKTFWQLENINTILELPISYEYIGPKRILENVSEEYIGEKILNKKDIENWIVKSKQEIPKNKIVIATFVINMDGILLLSDRHSEHVQCANKGNVLSAGEIGIEVINSKVCSIPFITNQSTGYCPSSNSWTNVFESLKKLEGLAIPDGFDPDFTFSYCSICRSLKIIKEEMYICYRCDNELLSENDFQKRRSFLDLK